MNTELVIQYLNTYNEHELFYKKYKEKKENPKEFQAFLDSLDRKFLCDNHLIVPELAVNDIESTPMQDFLYFNASANKSVHLEKHNRYTPAFMHTHTFFEIIYVLRGTCTHNIFGKSTEMHEGDLCLLSPSVVHSIYAENSLIINILIRRSNIEDIFFNVLRDNNVISDFLINSIYLHNYSTFLTYHTSGDEEVKNQILEMYLEQLLNDSYSDRIMSSMLIIFFTKLARKYQKTAESAFPLKKNYNAAKLLHCIVNEYNTITLSELAGKMGYSIPYCSKYIKELTGYSFLQLLKHVRFQKAEAYLLTTNFSIHKISDLLGYENPENFMRAFKKEYGISPSSFRTAQGTNHLL